MATCRSCGAEIIWVTTENGKRMPLDPHPHPKGSVLVYGEQAFVISAKGRADVREPLYLPHHMTCPQGRSWQRKQHKVDS